MNGKLFRRIGAACLAGVSIGLAAAGSGPQPNPLTPPENGPRKADPTWHAFTNVTVHPKPGEVIEHATVVIKDGRIVSVQGTPGSGGRAGEGAQPAATPEKGQPAGAAAAEQPKVDSPAPPPGARVWDCRGLHVYPGLIDPYVEVDSPRPALDSPGLHWNNRVTPQRSALDGKGLDPGAAESLRKMGFVAAGISPKGGIFKGWGAVVSLGKADDDKAVERPPVYVEKAYQAVAFDLSGVPGGPPGNVNANSNWSGYPDSEMGAIALIRQTIIDADWLAAAKAAKAEPDAVNALDALGPNSGGADRALLFNADDELEVLRAVKIAREFNRRAAVIGSGNEFKRLDAIKEACAAAGKAGAVPVIVPINFPEAPKVGSIGQAESVELRDLMTWEQAPTNPRRLAKAGLDFSLTTAKLKDKGKFRENVRKAILYGLTEDQALAAMTTRPATMLGVSDVLGTVEPGKIASFVLTDGALFAKKTVIRDVWVDGKRNEVTAAPTLLKGEWEVTLDPAPAPAPGHGGGAVSIHFSIDKDNNITITKRTAPDPAKPDSKEEVATSKAKGVRVEEGRLSFTFEHDPFGEPGVFVNSAVIEGDTIYGDAMRSGGQMFKWTAKKIAGEPAKPEVKKEEKAAAEPKPGEPKIDEKKVDAKEPEKKPEEKKDDKAADPLSGKWSGTATGGGLPEALPFSMTLTMSKEGAVTGSISSAHGTFDLGEPSFTKSGDTGGELKFTLTPPESPVLRFTATITNGSLTGTGQGGPEPISISATRQAAGAAADDEEEVAPKDIPENLGYPFGPYMRGSLPEQPDFLEVRGATIWTCVDGKAPGSTVIPNGTIIVRKGKVEYVGPEFKGQRPAGAVLVELPKEEGREWHITPGMIDCHSHTGISRGVNESGQAVTAEVRIEDVTNPDAVSWYWELAGGTTTVNNLHGSANPIGGQNCVNKIRWGVAAPDDMHLAGAMPGIKFALGENVKQSNWGDGVNTRYPKTRMGVETLIRDRFTAAKEYLAAQHAQKATDVTHPQRGAKESDAEILARVIELEKGRPDIHALTYQPTPRRDLELEALAEILEGKRLIHCHSYRQDEILMLCRIADEFGFKIGTFQHILEGYKVADEVRDHSRGGSSFSDWWAYKVEVQDAIPYDGAIMHDQGVCVSFNSDSDELARRMNVEAGKAVKYGGLTTEEAIKFLTINPARQLAIDDKVGTLEPGKDADFVVWSVPVAGASEGMASSSAPARLTLVSTGGAPGAEPEAPRVPTLSHSPISDFARCEATYIDGRKYFSREEDEQARTRDGAERMRLIQKVLAAPGKKKDAAKKDDEKTGAGPSDDTGRRRRRPPQMTSGSDVETSDAADEEPTDARHSILFDAMRRAADARREFYLDLWRRGIDPSTARCGDCGESFIGAAK